MTPDQQAALERLLTKILRDPNVLNTSKKHFDRSLVFKISEANKKIKIEVEHEDSGQSVMTVADVAAFLQTDRASVRRMTGERAQRRSHHPIPFVKIGGKMLRFARPAVEAWWKELCDSKNGKADTSALTLTKGKRDR